MRTEVRVQQLVRHVVDGGKCEGDLVDCKSKFPTNDPGRAAKQIAGLLNAARGSAAMWIVGLDEDAHKVVPHSNADGTAQALLDT